MLVRSYVNISACRGTEWMASWTIGTAAALLARRDMELIERRFASRPFGRPRFHRKRINTTERITRCLATNYRAVMNRIAASVGPRWEEPGGTVGGNNPPWNCRSHYNNFSRWYSLFGSWIMILVCSVTINSQRFRKVRLELRDTFHGRLFCLE